MKKNKNYIARIQIPLYGGEVFIYTDRETYSKATGDSVSDLEMHDGITDYDDSRTEFSMGLFALPTPGLIAHEALHVVTEVLDDRGVQISRKNSEAMTYLLEYLVNQIHKKLEKEPNGNQS